MVVADHGIESLRGAGQTWEVADAHVTVRTNEAATNEVHRVRAARDRGDRMIMQLVAAGWHISSVRTTGPGGEVEIVAERRSTS